MSPRSGDAVVACGGTLAGLVRGGWSVGLVTVFAGADRDADRSAADALGIADVVHLDVRRSPVDDDSALAARVAAALGPVLSALNAERVLAPLDPGDDLTAVEGLHWLDHPAPIVRWRAAPSPAPPLPDERGIPIAALLDVKVAACRAYGVRGPAVVETAELHGRRLGVDGPAEALVEPPMDRHREREAREEAAREERAALAKLRSQIARF